MASVSFTNLKLTVDKSVNTFDFNGAKIEVLKYLPIEDKKDLVQIAMQKSFEDGLYNNMLLDVYFHLNIVDLYSNLNITDKQKEDEFKLFDKLIKFLCFVLAECRINHGRSLSHVSYFGNSCHYLFLRQFCLISYQRFKFAAVLSIESEVWIAFELNS